MGVVLMNNIIFDDEVSKVNKNKSLYTIISIVVVISIVICMFTMFISLKSQISSAHGVHQESPSFQQIRVYRDSSILWKYRGIAQVRVEDGVVTVVDDSGKSHMFVNAYVTAHEVDQNATVADDTEESKETSKLNKSSVIED